MTTPLQTLLAKVRDLDEKAKADRISYVSCRDIEEAEYELEQLSRTALPALARALDIAETALKNCSCFPVARNALAAMNAEAEGVL